MGMWGFEPWGNDGAADWFGNLMNSTNLREHWLEGISLDPEDEVEEVRAALWLFVQLGRVYIWPIDHLDDDLELAIAVGKKILQNSELKEEIPEFVRDIEDEVKELESRLVK